MLTTATPIKSATQRESGRRFTKRIGNTTYQVAVHFSRTSKETAGDKIARLIRSEAAAGKAANQ